MDPITIGAIVGISLANGATLTAAIITNNRAAKYRKAADEALATAQRVAKELVTGQMLALLDRFEKPTPGCSCPVCDERRSTQSMARTR